MSAPRCFVALVRGINVGGHAPIKMADLRGLFEALGFVAVKTLLQSGNVVFQGTASSAGTMEVSLKKAATARWNLPIDFFVRDAAEWKTIIAGNPFVEEARRDPGHLLMMALKCAPPSEAITALRTSISGVEYFHHVDRQLFLVYPDGIGRSRFTSMLIEKKLGIAGTARNWNTVQKIAAMLEGP